MTLSLDQEDQMAKSVCWSGLLVVSLGLLASLAACAPDATEDIAPTAPSATLQPEPAAPQEDVAPPPTPGPEREDSRDVVVDFYTWYLGFEGNAFVEGVYQDHPAVSPTFVQAVVERLESFEKGGYDPFLCAQDRPDEVAALGVTVSGDVAVVTVVTDFVDHEFAVELEAEGQSWRITNVVCDSESDAELVPEVYGPVAGTEWGPWESVPGWPIFVEETYHFMVQYPEGWSIEDVDLDDPNKPPSGSMARLVYFAPADWDEDFIAFQMEVYDLDDEAFAMALPPATSEEEVVRDDGLVYTRLDHEFGEFTMRQYLFSSLTSPDVHVVFTDYLTGWPDRLEGNEGVAAVYEPMLASFGFTE